MNKYVLIVVWMLAAAVVYGGGGAGVSVNGESLSPHTAVALRSAIGLDLPPGSYRLQVDGCWVNLETGERGCVGGADCGADAGGLPGC